MGIFLNPGRQLFETAVNSPIYVDKTGVLAYLNSLVNTSQRYVCVSRPRRFGKSMTADMVCAYYERGDDVTDLFAPYAISRDPSFDAERNRYDVVHLTMLDFLARGGDVKEQLDRMQRFLIMELKQTYPDLTPFDESDLALTMAQTYALTHRQFVIVIDEWDCLFRQKSNESKETRDGSQMLYLDFLRTWLKDKSYVALAYMTDVLPIKKYGEHSALNMFDEYSMIFPRQFAPYTGFTVDEVKALCAEYSMDYGRVSDWYDGYVVQDAIPVPDRKADRGDGYDAHTIHLYSPLSVVNALRNGAIRNYWNTTESYDALKDSINRNFDGLHETIAMLMEGGRQRIHTDTYQNDMETFHNADDVLTMLIHLGYLGYDPRTSEVFIPNRELMAVFQASVRDDAKWDALFAVLDRSQAVLEATWRGDAARVAELLEEAHEQTGNQTYNSEAALSYAIRMAYFNAERYYTLVPEMQAGKGYADLVYIPAPGHEDKPAMIVELKWGKDADTALDQIRRQHYPDVLRKYQGNLLLVGINYDKNASHDAPDYKRHSCIIERA